MAERELHFLSEFPVTLRADGSSEQTCVLLHIKSGQIHLQTHSQIEPGSPVHLRLGRVTVEGVVASSTPKQRRYLTCVLVSTKSEEHRREPRFPVNLPCKVILPGGESNVLLRGRVVDISESGLGIKIPSPVEIESTACVETPDAVVAGAVRHCRKSEDGGFIAGILVTDAFSAELDPVAGETKERASGAASTTNLHLVASDNKVRRPH